MALTELTRIDRTIDINATPERVWRALTDVRELSTWFRMKIEGDIAAGREVWMTVESPGEYHGMRFPVKFVELTPPRRLVWQWHPGTTDSNFDYATEPQTTVTFTLEPTDRGTRLSVSETGFDALTIERRAKAFKENTQGWTEVLVWLQTHAEKAA